MPFPLAGRLLGPALTRNITFAGAIEDLPQPSNRVTFRNGHISIAHRYHPYDVHRALRMKKGFLPAMRRIPNSLAFAMIAKNEKLHAAHQVGTCRIGNDPAASARDKNCRLHHTDNLFVLDGSFRPTSLGVAPALTIMANALHVERFQKNGKWVTNYDEPISFPFLKFFFALAPNQYCKMQQWVWRRAGKFKRSETV